MVSKKPALVLTAAALCSIIALTGCGNNESPENSSTSNSSQTPSASPTASGPKEVINPIIPEYSWDSSLPENLEASKVESEMKPDAYVAFFSDPKQPSVPVSPFDLNLNTWVQITVLRDSRMPPGDFVQTAQQQFGEKGVVIENEETTDDGFKLVEGYYDLSEVKDLSFFYQNPPKNKDDLKDVYFKVYTSKNNDARFIVTSWAKDDSSTAKKLIESIELNFDLMRIPLNNTTEPTPAPTNK